MIFDSLGRISAEIASHTSFLWFGFLGLQGSMCMHIYVSPLSLSVCVCACVRAHTCAHNQILLCVIISLT